MNRVLEWINFFIIKNSFWNRDRPILSGGDCKTVALTLKINAAMIKNATVV